MVPGLVYVGIFALHFYLLTKDGPGAPFYSSLFQTTLKGIRFLDCIDIFWVFVLFYYNMTKFLYRQVGMLQQTCIGIPRRLVCSPNLRNSSDS